MSVRPIHPGVYTLFELVTPLGVMDLPRDAAERLQFQLNLALGSTTDLP